MFCVYLTTYSGNKLPRFYVGSTSTKKIAEGYHGSVASRRWRQVWRQELQDNPDLFSTQIISEHLTRKDAVEAELEWQLQHRVVQSEESINMAYAASKFCGNITPELVAAYRAAIAERSAEKKEAIRKMCVERQLRVMAARSAEKVRKTAEKQARSLAANHAKRSEQEKLATAEKKRKTLMSHDENWKQEVRARRSASMFEYHARRKETIGE